MATTTLLLTEAQVNVLAHETRRGILGNLVVAEEGENITLTFAQDGYLKFFRVAPDGAIIEHRS